MSPGVEWAAVAGIWAASLLAIHLMLLAADSIKLLALMLLASWDRGWIRRRRVRRGAARHLRDIEAGIPRAVARRRP